MLPKLAGRMANHLQIFKFLSVMQKHTLCALKHPVNALYSLLIEQLYPNNRKSYEFSLF